MTKALALLLISIVCQANGFFFGGYRPLFYGGYGGFGGFGGYGLGGFGRYGGFGFGGHGRYKRSLGDYDSQSHSVPESNVYVSDNGHSARVVKHDKPHHNAQHDLVPVSQVLSRPVVVERVHSRPAVVVSHHDGHNYGALVHARPASVVLSSHRTPVNHVVPVSIDRDHAFDHHVSNVHASRPAVVESLYDGHDYGVLAHARPASVGLSSHRTPVHHVVPVIIDRDHAFDHRVSNVHASDHGTGWGHEGSHPTHPATYIGEKSRSTIHSDHDSYHGTPVRRVHMRPATLESASHRAPVRVVRPVVTDSHDYHEHMY